MDECKGGIGKMVADKRKPKYSEKFCIIVTLSTTNSTSTVHYSDVGPQQWEAHDRPLKLKHSLALGATTWTLDRITFLRYDLLHRTL
jgi:hypothetical protein